MEYSEQVVILQTALDRIWNLVQHFPGKVNSEPGKEKTLGEIQTTATAALKAAELK